MNNKRKNDVPTAYSKVKKLQVTPEALQEIFKRNQRHPKLVEVTKGLPEDARLIRIDPHPKSGDYWLIFESNEFEYIEEGMKIPEIDGVEYKSYLKEDVRIE